MCIRDRTHPQAKRGRQSGCGQGRQNQAARQGGRTQQRQVERRPESTSERPNPRPVSYTHLTLPTICSV
eukprot:2611878-Alexandrium_andersonii.AAC.1